MTDREKLIELLSADPCGGSDCGACERIVEVDCYREQMADYLIANGVTAQEWISVKDRLPEGGRCVLVYSQDGGVAEGKYNARFKEWVQFRWSVTGLKNVTHWMPLPEPPKEE